MTVVLMADRTSTITNGLSLDCLGRKNGKTFNNCKLIKLMTTLHIIESSGLENPKKGRQTSQANPRKAATKVKEINCNVQMMKRRLLVLQGQEEYNRYKTLDHEKRINRHHELHQSILKDRQVLRKSLDKAHDLEQIKEKTEKMREQLRFKIAEARQNLMGSRTERSQQVNSESIDNQEKIKSENNKSQEENRQRKKSIQQQEQQTREVIISHLYDKIRRIKYNKALDADALSQTASKQQLQISRLAAVQKELICRNSQSLQASQIMKKRYNQIFTPSNSNASTLPEIRARTNNTRNTIADQYQ